MQKKKGCRIEGEMIDVNKKDNTVKIFMEKDLKEKEKDEKEAEEEGFVIEKIKFSDVETINIENMLDTGLKEGVNFSEKQR